jgi:YD repeat-containing protein
MNTDEIRVKAEALAPWYHEIELFPGYITHSGMIPCRYQWDQNRRVREKLDYKGKRVLDIGAMDGLWAFEAEQLGATSVVAADIFQRAPLCYERFQLARYALNSRVQLIPNGDVSRLRERLDWLGRDPFDIVQLLGVLYHLRDPMQALLQVRSVLAPSGTLFFETAIYADAPPGLWVRLNSDKGVYDDATTWWVPSVPALYDMLRLSGFLVIPGTEQTAYDPGRREIGRIALLAGCAPLESLAEYSGDLRLWL